MVRNIKKQKGFTLIEMAVVMAIFMTVMTMVIGFFIALYRLQTKYRMAVNLQEEGRIASEFFSRNAREAENINICIPTEDVNDPSCGQSDVDLAEIEDSYIDITLTTDEIIRVKCKKEGVNSYLIAASYKRNADPPQDGDMKKIMSNRSNITSFHIFRDPAVKYPKVLEYEIKLQQSGLDNGEAGLGESIFFRGYMNMRNEL